MDVHLHVMIYLQVQIVVEGGKLHRLHNCCSAGGVGSHSGCSSEHRGGPSLLSVVGGGDILSPIVGGGAFQRRQWAKVKAKETRRRRFAHCEKGQGGDFPSLNEM